MLNEFEERDETASLESPYAYGEGTPIEVTAADGNPLDFLSLRKSGTLGSGILILNALYKYPFLDRCSLEACLSGGRRFDGVDGKKIWDHLKFLIRGGLVVVLRRGDFQFYALSDAARGQMRAVKGYDVSIPEPSDLSGILETAALCRWHAHVTAGGNCGINVVRQKMKFAKKEVTVGSYVELKRTIPYRIFAFASPRGSSAEDFAGRLEEFWNLMDASARKGQASLTVIVASSIAEMEAVDRFLRAVSEVRGRRIHFALETRRGPDAYGFGGFYYFDREGDNYSLRSVSLG